MPAIVAPAALAAPRPAGPAAPAVAPAALAAPRPAAPAGPTERADVFGTANPVEPRIRPTWLWTALQLVPSPQWTVHEAGPVHFGLRWQVTPVLYSLGMRRGLSPWRFFVVEPNVRSWGSIEVFLSPEITFAPGPPERGLLGRVGARLHVPLLHAGEYLSMSGGASAFATWDRIGGAIEAGLYTAAGILGLQVAHAPDPGARLTTLSLSVRYF